MVKVAVGFKCGKTNDFGIFFSHKNSKPLKSPAPKFKVGRIRSPSLDLSGGIINRGDGANCVGKKLGNSGNVFGLVKTHVHIKRARTSWANNSYAAEPELYLA